MIGKWIKSQTQNQQLKWEPLINKLTQATPVVGINLPSASRKNLPSGTTVNPNFKASLELKRLVELPESHRPNNLLLFIPTGNQHILGTSFKWLPPSTLFTEGEGAGSFPKHRFETP